LKQAGPAFGYGTYANAISQTASGRYVVPDPLLRNEIMQLRKDPAVNALMGGVFTQQNAAVLANRLGRVPSEGELYIGHFFGPYAGAKAITLAGTNPTANAAEIFPAAARANRSIFYDKQGNARSIAGVCAELIRRYQAARAQAAPTPTVVAASAAPRPPASIPSVPGGVTATAGDKAIAGSHSMANVPRLTTPLPARATAPFNVPTLPSVTPAELAFAPDNGAGAGAPSSNSVAPVRGDGPGMFHSLFQTGERREAISPAISELWGTPTNQASAQRADGTSKQSPERSQRSLFTDR
jgi:hypothetical protein